MEETGEREQNLKMVMSRAKYGEEEQQQIVKIKMGCSKRECRT